MENLTGQQIKGYVLHELIASGGFGAVYRAIQSTIGREVAIKVILPELANKPEFVRRFEAEAQLIARIEHPFIVPLHDYWRNPDGAYLVMRYLRGGSLYDYIKQQGKLDIEEAFNILAQVSQGLHVAHRDQVVHRDIKPGNILLDEDCNAYLGDFGIAKDYSSTGSITEPDSFIGSPEYLAPEQARSEPVTPQTDIYSLGVVLYEMLAGEHPFPGVDKISYIYKHLNDPLPDILTLDAGIQNNVNDVIQKATAKDPKQRFKDVVEMMDAFRQAAQLDIVPTPTNLVELLTPREQEVMQLIIDGKTNREIADVLVLAEATVKSYIRNIYRKLNVRSRVQAIARARDLNFLIKKPETSRTTGHLPEPQNPYIGLSAFQAADAGNFFGRGKLIAKLLHRFQEVVEYQRFLAVVGPSGSGKSSVVKAGLIPALWRGDISGSDNWYIIDFIPGSHPLDELEVALFQIATDKTMPLREQLSRDNRGLLRVASMLLPSDDSELLIVIDQFEEVFTLLENEDERQHFLGLLREAVTDNRSRVRVIVTLRADYYDKPLQYPDFGDLVRDRVETVLPMSAEEIEQAITEPANQEGIIFEDGLVSRIVSDVHYQPGSLPLLQYALTELFERRNGRELTQEAYQEIGGTGGALANRADEIYLEQDQVGQAMIRQLFLRLVTLGDGAEDTRRRINRSELLEISEKQDLMDEIIDLYATSRLLSLDHDLATRHPTVEVAHEAILREWNRLRTWLNESRDDIRQERLVSQAATAWDANNRDVSFLASGTRLEQIEKWQAETELALTPLEIDYIQKSIQEKHSKEQAEAARLEREQVQEKRSQTLLRALVAVFALATILSGGFGLFALNSRNAEAEARRDAQTQASIGLAALAEQELEGIDRELGVLLALEAIEYYPFTPQAMGALAHSVEVFRPYRILDSSQSVAGNIMVATWSPNGEFIAAGSHASPKSVVIWDVTTGNELISVDAHRELCPESYNIIHDIGWSPSGDYLAVVAQDTNSGADCGVAVLDSSNGETVLTLVQYESVARTLDWSSDGTKIITGHEDGVIRMWDSHSGEPLLTLTSHTGIVYDATFSPDGRRIASASEDGTVRLWDTENGTEELVLWGHAGSVRSVDWSPDSLQLVSGGSDALPRVWDAINGETVLVLPGHTEDVVIVTWAKDGKRIATQGLEAIVKVWDAATGGLIFQITNTAPESGTKRGFIEFSPDGDELVAGGSRVLGVHVWDTSTSVPQLFGHTFGQEWGDWSPDGSMIATSGTDGSARLWDATTGEQIGEFDQGSYWSSWSPDGSRLVFADGVAANTLTVWDVATEEMLLRLSAPEDEYGAHQFLTMDWSPDGSMIAAADLRPGIVQQASYVWDAETSELIATLQTDDNCMQGWPRWSPDSRLIVSGCIFVEAGLNTPARIWDVASESELMRLDSEFGFTYHTVFSPDGTQVITGYEHGVARIWDVETGGLDLTFHGHQGLIDAAWSPDGTLIASTDFAEQITKIWNSETGEELMSFSVPGAPLSVRWSPDGTHIIVTGDGITVPIIKRIWRSPEELTAHAYDCCVSRDLTPEERNQFGLPER